MSAGIRGLGSDPTTAAPVSARSGVPAALGRVVASEPRAGLRQSRRVEGRRDFRRRGGRIGQSMVTVGQEATVAQVLQFSRDRTLGSGATVEQMKAFRKARRANFFRWEQGVFGLSQPGHLNGGGMGLVTLLPNCALVLPQSSPMLAGVVDDPSPIGTVYVHSATP
jgi:hypothetical protein